MNEREQQQFKKEKLKIDSVITIVVITACLGIIRSSVLHKKGLYPHIQAQNTPKKRWHDYCFVRAQQISQCTKHHDRIRVNEQSK